jgi:hypothetical protein
MNTITSMLCLMFLKGIGVGIVTAVISAVVSKHEAKVDLVRSKMRVHDFNDNVRETDHCFRSVLPEGLDHLRVFGPDFLSVSLAKRNSIKCTPARPTFPLLMRRQISWSGKNLASNSDRP